MKNHTEELARLRVPINWSQPAKIALWVQNGRVRAFINGVKHVDANQVDLPAINKVEILSLIAGAGQAVGYRSVRFAESTPDFSQVIFASGRYVSHGILFDTGRDRLKPESAAIIQSIARGLETNPNLKVLIEGHTDSVGNAAQTWTSPGAAPKPSKPSWRRNSKWTLPGSQLPVSARPNRSTPTTRRRAAAKTAGWSS